MGAGLGLIPAAFEPRLLGLSDDKDSLARREAVEVETMSSVSASSRLCGNCGSVVPEEHFFCGQCGASYGEQGAEDETLYFGAMQAPGRAKLILITGEGLPGLSYHLNSTNHIAGKGKGVILFPEDDYLDDEQAMFFYKANELYLRDCGSTNGTFLRIRKPRVLEHGDEILVGKERLRVEKLDIKEEYPARDETLMYVSPPKPYRFRLVHLLEGRRPGSAYCNIANVMTVGRQGTDVLFADDRHVCKQHCQVEWHDGKIVVTDLGSKNGTFVRVKQEEPLQHGDYVFLGSELVRVEINA